MLLLWLLGCRERFWWNSDAWTSDLYPAQPPLYASLYFSSSNSSRQAHKQQQIFFFKELVRIVQRCSCCRLGKKKKKKRFIGKLFSWGNPNHHGLNKLATLEVDVKSGRICPAKTNLTWRNLKDVDRQQPFLISWQCAAQLFLLIIN